MKSQIFFLLFFIALLYSQEDENEATAEFHDGAKAFSKKNIVFTNGDSDLTKVLQLTFDVEASKSVGDCAKCGMDYNGEKKFNVGADESTKEIVISKSVAGPKAIFYLNKADTDTDNDIDSKVDFTTEKAKFYCLITKPECSQISIDQAKTKKGDTLAKADASSLPTITTGETALPIEFEHAKKNMIKSKQALKFTNLNENNEFSVEILLGGDKGSDRSAGCRFINDDYALNKIDDDEEEKTIVMEKRFSNEEYTYKIYEGKTVAFDKTKAKSDDKDKGLGVECEVVGGGTAEVKKISKTFAENGVHSVVAKALIVVFASIFMSSML
jgi:hypothetical protein